MAPNSPAPMADLSSSVAAVPDLRAKRQPSQTVHWIIAILLAVIATALWMRPDGRLIPVASAQNQPLAGARGVFAFSGSLGHGRDGLFMLDVDQGTLWCYEVNEVGGTPKLKLIAARSWVYDRYLQDFNCEKPDFRMVQDLVAQQRARGGVKPGPAQNAVDPSGEAEGEEKNP